MFIRDFINNHIRFKRNVDEDIEDIWDLMIGGHAKAAQSVSAKRKLFNFIIDIIGIGLAMTGIMVIGLSGDDGGVLMILLASMIFLPIIVCSVLQSAIKYVWLSTLLCLVLSFVIGIILGAIGTAL